MAQKNTRTDKEHGTLLDVGPSVVLRYNSPSVADPAIHSAYATAANNMAATIFSA